MPTCVLDVPLAQRQVKLLLIHDRAIPWNSLRGEKHHEADFILGSLPGALRVRHGLCIPAVGTPFWVSRPVFGRPSGSGTVDERLI